MRNYLIALAVTVAIASGLGFAFGGLLWAVTLISPVGAVFSLYSMVRTIARI